MNNSIMDGKVYTHEIDDWSVSWESSTNYRHWCHQVKNTDWGNLLVVMFNPGSLSGDGKNLSKDTTLRILREVCGAAELNPYVINLFDFASPSPKVLFENWSKRDPEKLVYNKLPLSLFSAYILAYGDYENGDMFVTDIKERQSTVFSHLYQLSEISLPKNIAGTPKHPMLWQRQKIKPEIIQLLRNGA